MQVTIDKFEELDYAKREAINSLQTNISFCGDDNKVILFTSTASNEGKSSITMELGRDMAANEVKVLIIDADLRNSVLQGRHAVKSNKSSIKGLTHYLSGQAKMMDVICSTNVPNMDIILAGHTTPKPTELLRNNYYKELIKYARENYDVVLIDAPPLGLVIDAAVIAAEADGAIIVIEAGKCAYKDIVDVKKQLELTGVSVLGTVINKAPTSGGKYYSKYGKYGKYEKYGKYGKYGEK
ncbi:MAG: CpsD/CapB family tyrosine-protein kinase [Lachnospiraceae bacterium]|nr:CpsD/CapB family tyrosine-protein kinase [Lachnospiraceae bacterium]